MVTAREQRSDDLGDTRPRRGDKGDPAEMERRYRERGDYRTTADYMDEEYQRGLTEGSRGTTGPPASVGTRFRGSGRVSIGAPLAIEIIFISADELYNAHRFPVPSRLLVAFVVFGALGMAQGEMAAPADALAWAIVLATFYSGASEATGKGPPALRALDALGAFFGGKVGANRYGVPPGAIGPRGPVGPGAAAGSSSSVGASGAQGPHGPVGPVA